jgi:hypothetical protein
MALMNSLPIRLSGQSQSINYGFQAFVTAKPSYFRSQLLFQVDQDRTSVFERVCLFVEIRDGINLEGGCSRTLLKSICKTRNKLKN